MRTGTIKELIVNNTFNGITLNNVEFGVLVKTLKEGFATEVGKAPKPEGQRGKAATIWKLSDNPLWNVTSEPVVTVEASETEDSNESVETQESAPVTEESVEESSKPVDSDPFNTVL